MGADNFLYNLSGKYLEAFFQMLLNKSKGVFVSDRATQLSLHFIVDTVKYAHTYKLIKPYLNDLMFNVIFPELRLTAKDLDLWEEDDVEYVRKEFDFVEGIFSPKEAAINLLVTLLSTRKKATLNPFLQFAVSKFDQYNQTPMEQRPFLDKEALLLAIGSANVILQKKTAQHLEGWLAQHVFPEFQSPKGFLRARACWVVAQFSDIEWSDKQNAVSCVQSAVMLMQDPELPVRVQASLCVKEFVSDESMKDMFKPLLPQLLKQYFAIIQDVGSGDVIEALQEIVDTYEDDMGPHALEIIVGLSQAFQKLYTADEAEDDGLAASQCLSAITTVLSAIRNSPTLFPPVEPYVLPVVSQLLDDENIDYLEEVIEIMAYITRYAPVISPACWQIFPKLYLKFKGDGMDYLDQLLAPFDNYITNGTDVFLATKEYQDMMFDIAQTLLNDHEQYERTCQHACKLLESVIQNLKGRVDQWIQPYLELCWKRLQVAKTHALKMFLLEVFLAALYYNAAFALQIMEGLGITQQIFMQLFQMREKFERVYDKKLASLGLISILSLPVASLPAFLSQAYLQIVQTAMQFAMDAEKKREEEEAEQKKFAAMQNAGDDDDDEEEIEEDADGVTDEDAAYLADLATRTFTYEDFDNEDVIEEDEYIFNSPIDDVEEMGLLVETVAALATTDPNTYQGLMAGLGPDGQAKLQMFSQRAVEKKAKKAQEEAEAAAQGH
eukprot:GFYU01008639.1.p1 GENE.GFYU01008639.1~~GFYU01008639.1.p1  ORF type:complete len:722 (-),score=314.21 GFYU01008639.1:120-2285(-)